MPEGRGWCMTGGRATEAHDRGEAGGAAGVQEKGSCGRSRGRCHALR